MALVPLMYAALTITSAFSAFEAASLPLEMSEKEKDQFLELRQQDPTNSDDCTNKLGDVTCDGYRKKGYCEETYVDQMKKFCKKTCDFCGHVGCNVGEGVEEKAIASCNCEEGPSSPSCQLEFIGQTGALLCKTNTDIMCRLAVKDWADSYRASSNCEEDLHYQVSQAAWASCSSA